MGDFAAAIGSVERLLEWERLCTPLQHQEGITSVCQYDQSRFSDRDAAMIVSEHAGLAPDAVLAPPVQFTVTTDPWGLVIGGELDLASREVFVRVLGARLAARPWLRLDVSGLIYAEAAALGAVYQAAAGLPATAASWWRVRPATCAGSSTWPVSRTPGCSSTERAGFPPAAVC
jgi:hypothetical protein